MSMLVTYKRYTAGAIVLHWSIAALIIFQLAFGLWIGFALESPLEATKAWAFEQTQIHKSIGLTVLLLTLVRIGWRLVHPAPALPETMNAFEKTASHLSHVGFYFLMLALPLSGWAMVSASVQFGSIPTLYFGTFEIPHIGFLAHLPLPEKEQADAFFHQTHTLLAYGAIGLLVIHVAAALKHHIIEGDAVLARMTPGVQPSDRSKAEVHAPTITPLRAGAVGVVGMMIGASLTALYLVNMPAASVQTAAIALTAVSSSAEEASVSSSEDLATVTQWIIDPEQSAIRFSGTHTGNPFTGSFTAWTANVAFDEADLENSKVTVSVDMTSAKTGNTLYDGTLPQADWLNTGVHPKAQFETTSFSEVDGVLTAEGTLTIRDVAVDVSFPFELTINDDGSATVSANLVLDRTAFQIGMTSDALGAWVSKEIAVELEVVAQPKDGGGGNS